MPGQACLPGSGVPHNSPCVGYSLRDLAIPRLALPGVLLLLILFCDQGAGIAGEPAGEAGPQGSDRACRAGRGHVG